MFYPIRKAARLFALDKESALTNEDLKAKVESGQLPALERDKGLGWSAQNIPLVGEQIGFLKRPYRPLTYSVFVTKGGVLKTSLTLNLARLAALHNIRTVVIGLDMQCDITTALGYQPINEDGDSLKDAMAQLDATAGLFDFFQGEVTLDDILVASDLPTLSFIPETPELIALDQSLISRTRREYWLRDKVVEPLKEKFDLIVIDCSPNWNQLITNALVACDSLISPLECKINNFRNFKMFRHFVHEFRQDMRLDFEHSYIPTRLSPGRKLSREIGEWYMSQVRGATSLAVRDSSQGEEAMAMHLALSEFAPGTVAGLEMNRIMEQIWMPGTKASQRMTTIPALENEQPSPVMGPL